MSLFEKLNNKRYDLQEAKSGNKNKSFPSGSFDPANQEGKFVKNEKGKNLNQTSNSEINKRLSASTTKGDQARSQYGTDGGYGDSNVGDATQNKSPYKQPTKKQVRDIQNKSTINKLKKGQMPNIGSSKVTVNVTKPQTGVDAKTITKKYNQKNPNRKEFKKFFDPVKAKKAKDNLIAKRKEYGIDRKGNISDAGVKRYAQKTKQLSSGSNLPVTPTKKDLEVAKRRAVGGEKITNKSGKVIGTTTGKYGGNLPRARNKNMPSYAEVKAKIDAKEKVKNMYKKPKTVLKVAEPGTTKFKPSKFKGFVEVPTSNPVGKKILSKMDTTVNVPPKPLTKKPNVFQKLSKKFLDPQGWKIPKKDFDLKPLRIDKATGFPLSQTRKTFSRVRNIPGTGALKKGFAMLPNRYKVLGGLALTTYALTRPKDKAVVGGKADKITYKKVEKPLGFDTGKKVNQDRISYNQFLKKNNITDPQQKTFLAKQKERSDNAAARARRNSAKPTQYGSTFTYKDKKTGEVKTGSKFTTKKPKDINKNLP